MKKALLAITCLLGLAAPTLAQENQLNTDAFYWPAGDASSGRETFIEYGCASCHRVASDRSLPGPVADRLAPELDFSPGTSQSEIAQAILSPSHTIAEGFGEGTPEDMQKSPMTGLSDRLTIAELGDILAYLTKNGEAGESEN